MMCCHRMTIYILYDCDYSLKCSRLNLVRGIPVQARVQSITFTWSKVSEGTPPSACAAVNTSDTSTLLAEPSHCTCQMVQCSRQWIKATEMTAKVEKANTVQYLMTDSLHCSTPLSFHDLLPTIRRTTCRPRPSGWTIEDQFCVLH